MIILGISGKRGVGKTTLANYLCKYHGFEKVSFADRLREFSKTLFPFTDSDFSDIKKKEAPFKDYEWSPREFMIHFGEFMRFHDQDYWLNAALADCSDAEGNYVFDDVRYKNEANFIRDCGGKLVRVNRHESSNPYGKNLNTASETDLDDYKFDYTVEDIRNTSVRELYNHDEAILDLCKESGEDA